MSHQAAVTVVVTLNQTQKPILVLRGAKFEKLGMMREMTRQKRVDTVFRQIVTALTTAASSGQETLPGVLKWTPNLCYSIDIMVSRDIVMITWQDAAFSFEKSLPATFPEPRKTFGVIAHEAEDYIFIATNLYQSSQINDVVPVDGMLIPRDAIKEVKKMSELS